MFVVSIAVLLLTQTFFENQARAHFLMIVLCMSFLYAATDVIREINRATNLSRPTPARVLRFQDTEYEEPAWRVLAITSGYVILRRHLDGLIHVHAKADLKSVFDRPKSGTN
jgi:hypothetical protein